VFRRLEDAARVKESVRVFTTTGQTFVGLPSFRHSCARSAFL